MLVQTTSEDNPITLSSHTKTTPWPHMVVKNDKQENARDTLINVIKTCLTSAKKIVDSEIQLTLEQTQEHLSC